MKFDQLLTLASLLTTGGGSLGVMLVGNVAQYVLRWNPRWLGLVIALGIGAIGAAVKPTIQWTDWVVAFFQGLQIYAAAVGIASITGDEKPLRKSRGEGTAPGRQFFVRWF
jgi:hypothetical protein